MRSGRSLSPSSIPPLIPNIPTSLDFKSHPLLEFEIDLIFLVIYPQTRKLSRYFLPDIFGLLNGHSTPPRRWISHRWPIRRRRFHNYPRYASFREPEPLKLRHSVHCPRGIPHVWMEPKRRSHRHDHRVGCGRYLSFTISVIE